jgi:alanine-glyoxylate transaminase/serine-glyoxylate transaminase/serine-pyruvate transaminase
MSERAWAASQRATLPRGYWDFPETRKNVVAPTPMTNGTPPVHPMLQVAEALRMMHEEGLANVFRRHEQLAERTRAGVKKLGFGLQCPALTKLAPTLTAVAMPAGREPGPFRNAMRERGIEIASGLGKYDATAFRIGHMGDITIEDVDRTLKTISEVM